MTGQTLLNLMEMLDRELQLQTGEDDVVRGLLALNAAQDQFETLLATFPNTGGSNATVSTSSGSETTTFPTGLLRLDRLSLIDPVTSLPAYDLDPLKSAGAQARSRAWPYSMISSTISGRPTAYWEDGTSIYWSPVPDATYTIRYYGLVSKTDITATDPFLYPDSIALPLAAVAAKLIKTGLEDDGSTLDALGQSFLVPAIRQMDRHNRDRATGLNYSQAHEA